MSESRTHMFLSVCFECIDFDVMNTHAELVIIVYVLKELILYIMKSKMSRLNFYSLASDHAK